MFVAGDVERILAWADALYRKRRLEFGKDSMETQCLPLGPAYLTSRYRQIRIVQTPTLVVFLFRFRGLPQTDHLLDAHQADDRRGDARVLLR